MDYALKDVLIELTKQCNLRCLHCGSSCKATLHEKELELDEWVAVIQTLGMMGAKKVIFSGGEPTLEAVRLTVLIRAAVDNGLKYGVITNGLHVSDFIINTMSAYLPFGVGVSLDGMKDTHNEIRCHQESWQQALRTILNLQNAGIRVCAITTLSKMNVGELDRIARLLEALEVPCWQLQLALPAGRAKKNKIPMIDTQDFKDICDSIIDFKLEYPNIQIEAADCFGMAESGVIRTEAWNGCGAGITMISIDATGRIMPCLSLRGHYCGHIRDGIKNVWEDSSGFDFNRKFDAEKVAGKNGTYAWSIAGRCAKSNCEFLETCRGGCASQSYFTHGHFHDSPFCYRRSFSPGLAFQEKPGEAPPLIPGGLIPDGMDSVIKYGLPEDRPPASPGVPVVPGHVKYVPPESPGVPGTLKYGLPEEHVLPEKGFRPTKGPRSPWGEKKTRYKG